jgi:hypothetical protein
MFRGDNGKWHGVEATSGGGWVDDESQQNNFPFMTRKSIESGMYMQALTRKESAVVAMWSLFEFYERQNTNEADEARIALARLMLEHYPKDMMSRVQTYLGYRNLRKRLFIDRYAEESDIPVDRRAHYDSLTRMWLDWADRLKAVGFQASNPGRDPEYRRRIERARAGIQ